MVAVTGLLAAPASADAKKLDPDDVEEFTDTRMAELMAEQRIPGAAISVVAGGEEVFSNGYDEADRETGEPVSAETTVFPTGSVAKSFTAVAALQLVEQGELDLDTDVNTYLPEEAHLSETPSSEPVTLHHLLTHTAGFEERQVSHNDPTMLSTLLGSYRPASVAGDGIRMSCSSAMDEQRWHPVGDGLFRSEDGEEWAGYIEDDGEVVGFVCDSYAVNPYVQVDWHETVYPKLIMAGAAALMLLSMLARPLTALARRLFHRAPRTGDESGRAPRLARWAAGGTGLLLAGALGTLAALMSGEVG